MKNAESKAAYERVRATMEVGHGFEVIRKEWFNGREHRSVERVCRTEGEANNVMVHALINNAAASSSDRVVTFSVRPFYGWIPKASGA